MRKESSEITEAVMKALATGAAGAIGFSDPVAGAAIAAGTEGITLAFRATGSALSELRLNRAKQLIQKASENAGKSPEDFWAQVCQSEKLLDAAFIALDAGSKTALKEKIDLYAKILADEVSSTDEVLEAVKIRLKTLSIIERPHLEILHVIASISPNIAPKDSNDLGWTNDNIAQELPNYQLILPALLEPMLGSGLIWNNGLGRYGYKAYWKLTELGEDCLRMLSGGRAAKATNISAISHPPAAEPAGSIIQPIAKTDFNIVKLEIVDANGRPLKKPFHLKNGENVFKCIATYGDGSTAGYEPYWTCPIVMNRGREPYLDFWGVLGQNKRNQVTIHAGNNHVKYTELSCWVFPPKKETPTGNREIPHDGTGFDYSSVTDS